MLNGRNSPELTAHVLDRRLVGLATASSHCGLHPAPPRRRPDGAERLQILKSVDQPHGQSAVARAHGGASCAHGARQ